MKRSSLRRGKPLNRRRGLAPKKPRRPAGAQGFNQHPPSWTRHRVEFRVKTCGGKVCAVCQKRTCLPLDPHHVLAQRYIRRYVSAQRGLDTEQREELLISLLFDPRNGMPVGRPCHEPHEKAVCRIPWSLIPPSAIAFAQELDLEWLLERQYPKEEV